MNEMNKSKFEKVILGNNTNHWTGYLRVGGGIKDSLKKTLQTNIGSTTKATTYGPRKTPMSISELKEATEKYHPKKYIHDILLEILKGEEEWEEDRETILAYLSQVLFSIIDPEQEKLVKETLIESAVKRYSKGEIENLKSELSIAQDLLRQKGYEISTLQKELAGLKDEISNFRDEMRSKFFSPRDYYDQWDSNTLGDGIF